MLCLFVSFKENQKAFGPVLRQSLQSMGFREGRVGPGAVHPKAIGLFCSQIAASLDLSLPSAKDSRRKHIRFCLSPPSTVFQSQEYLQLRKNRCSRASSEVLALSSRTLRVCIGVRNAGTVVGTHQLFVQNATMCVAHACAPHPCENYGATQKDVEMFRRVFAQ